MLIITIGDKNQKVLKYSSTFIIEYADEQCVNRIIEFIEQEKIRKADVSNIVNIEWFIPVFHLLDKLKTNNPDQMDHLINLGFGHKVLAECAPEKYIGIIHPKSVFRFNLYSDRVRVTKKSELRELAGRQMDHINIQISDFVILDNIQARSVTVRACSCDFRQILCYEHLKKIRVYVNQIHPGIINHVECRELQKYEYRTSAGNIQILALDQLLEDKKNSRFKRVKVAMH